MNRSVALAVMALGLALGAKPVVAACTLDRIIELPVTLSDLRPMVPAKINGADAMFIAESGAAYSMISPSSAAQYGLKLKDASNSGHNIATLMGIGGEVGVSLTAVKMFTIAGVTIPNVEFLVGGSEPGNGAVGLLGQNVLGLYDAEYDLANGVVRLMRPRGCDHRALAYWAVAKPFSVMDINPDLAAYHTAGVVSINGVKVRAIFDTGGPVSFLSRRAAARAGVKPGDLGVTAAAPMRGIGRRAIETWIGSFASFKIGDEEIRDTRLRIGDFDLGDGVDMLIGTDFFLSHRVYVANSQNKLYFTYNGGPVFNLNAAARTQTASDPAPKAAPPLDEGRSAPTDAEGFARRGAAFAARRDFDHAVADYTRACEMAPTEAKYFYERAIARSANGQPLLAMADLDRTLKLKPDNVPARLARAQLRLAGRDTPGATVDLDAATRFAPSEADVRLSIAELYERADQLEPAITQYTVWIAAHPQDSRLPLAMNGRCWARALTGRDLDKALADCNAALKSDSRSPNALDSRALVRLRLGDLDESIADYDASLKLRPKSAWSLYGRGLAKLRYRMKAEGEADIAAATALQPSLPAEMKKYGVTP